MIVMIVGQRKISDVGRLVPDLRQLAFQSLVHGGSSFGRSAWLNQLVGNDAGIPKQSTARMHDEISGDGHVRRCHAPYKRHARIAALQRTPSKNIKFTRGGGLSRP